jgi:hypothetical protein
MRDNGGDGEAPGDGSGAEIDRVAKSVAVRDGRPDLSPAAVNSRLASFIAEHKAALAKGDPRALRESDRLLCSWAEEALEAQARSERALAEIERRELEARGGRLQ